MTGDNHAIDHIVNEVRKQNRELKQGIVDILRYNENEISKEVADKLRKLLGA